MDKIISLDVARAAQRKGYHVPLDDAARLLGIVKNKRPGLYATLAEMICEFSGVPAESLAPHSDDGALTRNG